MLQDSHSNLILEMDRGKTSEGAHKLVRVQIEHGNNTKLATLQPDLSMRDRGKRIKCSLESSLQSSSLGFASDL